MKERRMKKIIVLLLIVAFSFFLLAPGVWHSPGYWKNHPEAWPSGTSTNADFDATFGSDWFNPNITLMEALWLHGGGVNMQARYKVANWLNTKQ